MKRLILMLFPLLLWGISGCVPKSINPDSPCDFEFSFDFKGEHFLQRSKYNSIHKTLAWKNGVFEFDTKRGSFPDPDADEENASADIFLGPIPFVIDSVYSYSRDKREERKYYVSFGSRGNKSEILRNANFTFTSPQETTILFGLLIDGQTEEGDSLSNFKLTVYKTCPNTRNIKSLIIPRK